MLFRSVQPPTASWGSLVADGRAFLLDAWWVSTFPGLAILALVLVNRKANARNAWPVEGAVKYWHFVDLVWVVVYPTLYLVG